MSVYILLYAVALAVTLLFVIVGLMLQKSISRRGKERLLKAYNYNKYFRPSENEDVTFVYIRISTTPDPMDELEDEDVQKMSYRELKSYLKSKY